MGEKILEEDNHENSDQEDEEDEDEDQEEEEEEGQPIMTLFQEPKEKFIT